MLHHAPRHLRHMPDGGGDPQGPGAADANREARAMRDWINAARGAPHRKHRPPADVFPRKRYWS